MRRLLTLLAFAAFSCSDQDGGAVESSFQGEIAWSKNYGGSLDEFVGNAAPTPDGGLIAIAYTDSNDGDVQKQNASTEIWLLRLDAQGNKVWSRTLGGSADDYGTSITATHDGHFAISGYSGSNDGDVPGNLGMHDFLISKIDIDGNILWSRNYGFMSHDHAHKVIGTKDGGFFIAGYADYAGIDDNGNGNSGPGHDMRGVQHGVGEFFGIKLDAQGNLEWYRYFGGTMNDRVNDLALADDGGILMAGYTESSDYDIEDSRGSYDYWVIKLDSEGSLHWKKNFGGSGIDQAFAIVNTGHNSYLVAGRSNSTDGDVSSAIGNFDAWVVHFDDHGHLLWEKSFGTIDYDAAASIRPWNGKFILSGNSRGSIDGNNQGENDYWVFSIDAHPNTGIHWQKSLGGSSIDMATDALAVNSGLVVLGQSQSADGDVSGTRGGADLWLVKLQ